MSSCMLGRLVKGPIPAIVDTDEYRAALQRAEEALRDVYASRRDWHMCRRCMEHIPPERAVDGRCPECCDDTEAIAEAYPDAAALGAELRAAVRAWPPDTGDAFWRDDPDDAHTMLVFAGEASYGDEPEGAGYGALKELMNLIYLLPRGVRKSLLFR